MYTQNTPVHVHLWHRGFWALAFANLLLSMSVFMFLPILPYWLGQHFGLSASKVALLFVIHAVGIYLLGPRCSMLVQRYRRNVVCAISILLTSLSSFVLYYLCKFNPALIASLDASTIYLVLAVIQLVGSMFYGLSQMVLSGTLIIDVCESFQRTEANHSAAWFGRLGLALGPIVAILTAPRFGSCLGTYCRHTHSAPFWVRDSTPCIIGLRFACYAARAVYRFPIPRSRGKY